MAELYLVYTSYQKIIRLEPISPDLLTPVFNKCISYLQDKGIIDSFRSINDNLLIPLDGTWFFSSSNIGCN